MAITIQFINWSSRATRSAQCRRCVSCLLLAASTTVFMASLTFLWAPGPLLTNLRERGYPTMLSDVPLVLRHILLAGITCRLARRREARCSVPLEPDPAELPDSLEGLSTASI
eukprot:TRINITY_DN15852_c0_g1_i2.p1 TRINITY_DN15852_c0_g1~~TRINITY_DN15852_c0_g1_i2.p1  ORF type:complete len:113 (+),score=0.80 TRINITY_DN15852_c0_g1_i2:41-379(+)